MYMYMCIQASRPKPLTQGTIRQRNNLPRGKIVKTHTHTQKHILVSYTEDIAHVHVPGTRYYLCITFLDFF